MTGRLAGALTWMLAGVARLLPADRRHWAEAVRAEADEVPAGWPRLAWLAGGIWLVAREGAMARRIGYLIGAAGIAAAAAWVVWLSWRTSPSADAESATDRARVLVGLAALVGLPWVGRRHGLFGPVADSGAARLARIGGCAAICLMGLAIVRIDRHSSVNTGVGTGHFSWLREAAGVVLLIAAVTAPSVLRARRPRAAPEMYWVVAITAGAIALFTVPIQAFGVGSAAVVLAATARQSPVTAATWTAGLIASLPTAAAAFLLPFAMGNLYNAMFVVGLVAAAAGAGAGAGAARLVPRAGSPDALRTARTRQGSLAGAIAGTTGGLAAVAFSPILGEMMVAGLLAGLAGGFVGASIAAGRPVDPVDPVPADVPAP